MKTLNVIGAGRVGRTLASLWAEKHTFAVQDLVDRTIEGARSAVAFIGDGEPAGDVAGMRAADVWMLTTPDRHIAPCSKKLAASGLLRSGDIVFHCSGSMSSAELTAATSAGASTASVHPLKTFADPRVAVRTFAGTYCASEGEPGALEVLNPAFERIGGRVSEIDPRFKTIYHAASVMVCNYLTTLMEAGLRCYETAGISRDIASPMIEPIVRETIDNIFELGPAHALTGPIARGDDVVVERHLEALTAWDAPTAAIYRDLGRIALELARAQGNVDSEALRRLGEVLDRAHDSTSK
ncbi:MAG: hypothetical protein V7640_1321 [Betaproteobacteria bacterium]|jgi:predicted short-subunit dehydrogenase-like oxidoreductase (DUF2520 family)